MDMRATDIRATLSSSRKSPVPARSRILGMAFGAGLLAAVLPREARRYVGVKARFAF